VTWSTIPNNFDFFWQPRSYPYRVLGFLGEARFVNL